MLVRLFFAFIFSMCLVCNSLSQEVKLLEVVDGDTLLLEVDRIKKHYAIYGIDAPEIGQFFGKDSKNYIENILSKSIYKIEVNSINASPVRTVNIYYKENNYERDLACSSIYKGFSFYDRMIKSNNDKYIGSEKMARKAKLGVWSKDNVEFPWDYRKKLAILEEETIEAQNESDIVNYIVKKNEIVQKDQTLYEVNSNHDTTCTDIAVLTDDISGNLYYALRYSDLNNSFNAERATQKARNSLDILMKLALTCNCSSAKLKLDDAAYFLKQTVRTSSSRVFNKEIVEAIESINKAIYEFEYCGL